MQKFLTKLAHYVQYQFVISDSGYVFEMCNENEYVTVTLLNDLSHRICIHISHIFAFYRSTTFGVTPK